MSNYKYKENKQLAAAKRAVRIAKKAKHDFVHVEMTKEKSISLCDSLHKEMSSPDNYEFVK